jgi:hypothetical protein
MSRAVDDGGDDEGLSVTEAYQRWGGLLQSATKSSTAVHHPDGDCPYAPEVTESVTVADLPPSVTVCTSCDPTMTMGGGEAGCSTPIADVRVCDYGSCLSEAPLRVEVRGTERAVCGEHKEPGHRVIGVTGDREKGDTELWLRHQHANLGRSTREIEAICGVPHGTIGYRLNKYDIPIRPVNRYISTGPHNDAGWLREQYQTRERTAQDIANECGVSGRTVRRRMDEFGIKRRSGACAAADTAESNAEEPRSQGETPTPDAGQTPVQDAQEGDR